MTAFRRLLDRRDLKFLRAPLSTHTFSLCTELWLRTVYNFVVAIQINNTSEPHYTMMA
jgi:hypothetical protein